MNRLALIFGAVMMLWTSSSSATVVVDGNISDWGVNLSDPAAQNKNYLDTHLPSGGNDIDAVTEDNADIHDGTVYVGPGYSIGNLYDAEAMYIDNDYQYLYLAIVTGVSPNELTFPAGDIFFDTGTYQNPLSPLFDTKKYGFGIDINTGSLYAVNSWQDVLYAQHASSNPWKIGGDKTLIGNVDLVYSNTPVNSHYIMETRIPLAFLNLNPQTNPDIWAHWTMMCGNDPLNLHGDVNGSPNAVPEPGTWALMSAGMAFLGLARRKS